MMMTNSGTGKMKSPSSPLLRLATLRRLVFGMTAVASFMRRIMSTIDQHTRTGNAIDIMWRSTVYTLSTNCAHVVSPLYRPSSSLPCG